MLAWESRIIAVPVRGLHVDAGAPVGLQDEAPLLDEAAGPRQVLRGRVLQDLQAIAAFAAEDREGRGNFVPPQSIGARDSDGDAVLVDAVADDDIQLVRPPLQLLAGFGDGKRHGPGLGTSERGPDLLVQKLRNREHEPSQPFIALYITSVLRLFSHNFPESTPGPDRCAFERGALRHKAFEPGTEKVPGSNIEAASGRRLPAAGTSAWNERLYRPAFIIRASNLPPRSSTYRLASASAAGQYCMGEAI